MLARRPRAKREPDSPVSGDEPLPCERPIVADLIVGLLRWSTRLNAYMYLLTDQYPPFSFE